MLIRDLGLMAEAVYSTTTPTVAGFSCVSFQKASSAWNGFQAAAFAGSDGIVVAFRGTDQAVDVGADLQLGVGMNNSYFSQGEDFVALLGEGNITVCGHSLGGAIAQVVANRRSLPMVTFNAPGVAVFASRNFGDATTGMTAVRAAGMMARAALHPFQAARDVASTFNVVKGLNICLAADVVSRIGIHYGEIVRIPGTSTNPKTEHGIATVNAVLRGHPLGSTPAVFS
jgi:pimeloyl-ACP methyl ester carboxylesterase